ncbi:helix-turn-helix transcriptional regulator [Jatrophihabitans sp.]|uniref:helix-turn-helix transcriptional regulator n=1 Tax=Jatrophihabitans sp. TaxID=1932789 RepID=UPI002B916241|nr:WYL domain-containing protein [Jatrophihabitans sp.]
MPEPDAGGRRSPTARALLALELLQLRQLVAAGELASHLGVTERAVRRYVAILREAGLPVITERGPYGGYRLDRGRRSPALVLSSTEALGLVMAALDGSHQVGDVATPVGAALGKLVGSLPGSAGQTAASMRAHVLSAPGGRVRLDPGLAAALVTAVDRRRRVRLGYRTAAGTEASFEVDPWAVVVRFGRWYLLCFAHGADAVRTLRVDRITDLVELDAAFVPPADLDPVALLERHLGSSWTYPTRVVFDAPAEVVRPFVPAAMGRLEEIDGGTRCVVVGSTDNPEMYACERLAAIPFPMRVEGGDELRQAVAALARRMAAATAG